MKTESKEVVGDVANEVVNVVSGYEKQLRELVEANYPLTEVRVNLETGQVFVVWKDYSDEEQRAQELIAKYTEVKSQITDPIAQPTLMKQLVDIAGKFKELTGMNIEEVVG